MINAACFAATLYELCTDDNLGEASEMTWAMHEYMEDRTENNLPPRKHQFMLNDDGVRIELVGRHLNYYQSIFDYSHGDIKIRFQGYRPSDNWVDYDPTNKTYANFALGPVCRVWLDDRHMPRRLSADEKNIIKANVTEFLTKEFWRFEEAVAPHPEIVSFY